jgi:hypothetical protein
VEKDYDEENDTDQQFYFLIHLKYIYLRLYVKMIIILFENQYFLN